MVSKTEYKTMNAIKYFVLNTKKMSLTKLFKLLYFLDLRYFSKYGLNITLLDYYTFPFGPVPAELYNKISTNQLPEYLINDISFAKQKDSDYERNPLYLIKCKNPKIDLECFAPYELETLKEVADIFLDVDANTISDISHFKNQPWDITKNTLGMGKLIDFELIFDENSNVDIESIREYINLQKELKADGRI